MRIHAIATGRVRVKASQLVGRGGDLARRLAPIFDGEWSGWLPTYAFAVEQRDGVVLIDTGVNAGLKRLPRWHPYFQLAVKFDVEPEQEAGPQLRVLGIAPSDVKMIVLTHLHIDHDGGLAPFHRARVLVSAGERAAAAGFIGRINGYLPQRWPTSFDPEPLVFADEPFGPFARSRRLTADGALVALPTPGHTASHVSVVLDDGERRIVFVGDAAYSQDNLLAGRVDGISPNAAIARDTMARLAALAAERPTVLLPAHDPDAAGRLARGEAAPISVPAAHAA
ncbi:MAG: MBL fold metallo-hydrolase [Roseiarcus sp.]|jgi:glyoxylase-like metal-dependent hydrolase (beta-lactamase superfamily II)